MEKEQDMPIHAGYGDRIRLEGRINHLTFVGENNLETHIKNENELNASRVALEAMLNSPVFYNDDIDNPIVRISFWDKFRCWL